jgi:hypothetical protein
VDTEEIDQMIVTAIAQEVGAHMEGGREVRAPRAAAPVALRHEDNERRLALDQGAADGEEARAILIILPKAGVQPAVARDDRTRLEVILLYKQIKPAQHSPNNDSVVSTPARLSQPACTRVTTESTEILITLILGRLPIIGKDMYLRGTAAQARSRLCPV